MRADRISERTFFVNSLEFIADIEFECFFFIRHYSLTTSRFSVIEKKVYFLFPGNKY
jgi:hypothetical protein